MRAKGPSMNSLPLCAALSRHLRAFLSREFLDVDRLRLGFWSARCWCWVSASRDTRRNDLVPRSRADCSHRGGFAAGAARGTAAGPPSKPPAIRSIVMRGSDANSRPPSSTDSRTNPNYFSLLRTVALSAGVSAVTLACCIATPTVAWAAENDAVDAAAAESAVDRLTDAERALLLKKLPNWGELDPARQEHIARRVLRLRDLSDEQRRALRTRSAEMRRRMRKSGRDPHERHQRTRRGALPALLGRILSRTLDGHVQATLTDAQRAQGLTERSAKRALLRPLWTRVMAYEVAALRDELEADENPADAQGAKARIRIPRDVREALAAEVAPTGRQAARLGGFALEYRFKVARRDVAQSSTPLPADQRMRAVTERLQERWQPVLDGVLKEFTAKPERWLGPMRMREMAFHVRSLERLAQGGLAAEAREQALALQRHLLVKHLGVSAETIDAMPLPGSQGRSAALRELLAPHLGKDMGRGAFRRGRGHRGDRPGSGHRGRGDGPRGERPPR